VNLSTFPQGFYAVATTIIRECGL